MRRFSYSLMFFFIIVTCSKVFSQTNDTIDLKNYFSGFKGAMVIYDYNNKKYLRYNKDQCALRVSPASTFKIMNSLIGLETGVIKDADFVIKWDGVERYVKEWNRDHTLRSAILYSVVPYYQELARRVGEEKMQYYLDKTGYGNNDISGGIDHFWLGSSLKISPDEEVEFLVRLYENKVPFSQRTIDIVKDIIPKDEKETYVLHWKTGAAELNDTDKVGWFVGYVESNNDVYFFALNILGSDFGKIMPARRSICEAVLKELKIIQ